MIRNSEQWRQHQHTRYNRYRYRGGGGGCASGSRRVVPLERTLSIQASTLAAAPLLHVGWCGAAQPCCRLFSAKLGRLHAADINTVGAVPAMALGIPVYKGCMCGVRMRQQATQDSRREAC